MFLLLSDAIRTIAWTVPGGRVAQLARDPLCANLTLCQIYSWVTPTLPSPLLIRRAHYMLFKRPVLLYKNRCHYYELFN